MPTKVEEVKFYNPNEDADGQMAKAIFPTFTGQHFINAQQYMAELERHVNDSVNNGDTITKAVAEFHKSIQAPPQALSFGTANIMPDPSSSSGVRPWPGISPESLGKIVQENIAPQLIIGMRVDDILRYSVKSAHPWRPGWRIEVKEGDKIPSTQDKKDILEAETFLQNSNVETTNAQARQRDGKRLTNFQHFLAALTRDSLTYDGIAVWTDMTQGKGVKGYSLMPAAYIRLVDQNIGYEGDKNIFAVLLDQGGKVATTPPPEEKPITFTRDQLAWYVRNPRIDPYIGGYGYPEVEIAVRIIQGFQNAIDLNVDTFNKSGVPNGMLVLEGGGWVQKQLDVLMRQWNNLKKGITKFWALPVLATPPDGKVSLLNFNDLKGTDVRYQDHMNMMVGALCTVYRFPVHRLGYRISGKGPDTNPMPDSQVRIIDEDDPGLMPFLTHIETFINEYLIWPRWANLRFAFLGKNPKEDAREYEFRKNAMTMGEARAETDQVPLEDLPDIKGDKDLKFVAKLMSMAPLDSGLAGVFQSIASSLVKAKFEGTTADGERAGARFPSAKDPARTEGHGRLSGVRRSATKKGTNTLYVYRPLLNADDLIEWARDQGFSKTLEPDDFHVTIAFSRTAVDWENFVPSDEDIEVPMSSRGREVKALGDKGAVVLKFNSRELHSRWEEFCKGGCSWDYLEYQSHVTITYSGSDMDLSQVEPYTGELWFGSEVFNPVKENWDSEVKEVEI